MEQVVALVVAFLALGGVVWTGWKQEKIAARQKETADEGIRLQRQVLDEQKRQNELQSQTYERELRNDPKKRRADVLAKLVERHEELAANTMVILGAPIEVPRGALSDEARQRFNEALAIYSPLPEHDGLTSEFLQTTVIENLAFVYQAVDELAMHYRQALSAPTKAARLALLRDVDPVNKSLLAIAQARAEIAQM